MSDIQNFLKALICDMTSPDGGRSLNLNVILTDGEEVKRLQAEKVQLEKDFQKLLEQYHRTEYLYRCEVIINNQLTDYVRDLGIEIPKRLFRTKPD